MPLTPLDFPASPSVGDTYPIPPITGVPTYRWDGGQWLAISSAAADKYVRFDAAQGLNATQKAQGRSNIDAASVTATRARNYIINGAMQVSQENAATAGTGTGFYPADQFIVTYGNAGTQTSQQVVSFTPSGSPNRLRVTATVADAALAASDYLYAGTRIEGLRTIDLRFGSAAAKTITLQFGVKAPAGTYCVAFKNAAADRVYVAEYVIAGGEANTDTIKSITLTGDVTGTWATDNTAGLFVVWGLMFGATYQTASGSWGAGNFYASSSQSNFMGTAGNIFELFDVSLTEGSVAPPFQVPDYARELAACQRYYCKVGGAGGNDLGFQGSAAITAFAGTWINFPVSMRASPTATRVGTWTVSNCPQPVTNLAGVTGVYLASTATATGNVQFYTNGASTYLTANARL